MIFHNALSGCPAQPVMIRKHHKYYNDADGNPDQITNDSLFQIHAAKMRRICDCFIGSYMTRVEFD